MQALLRFEAVGDYLNDATKSTIRTIIIDSNGIGHLQDNNKKRYWCAEILDLSDNQYKFERHFLRAFKDYANSNSIGSRGVYVQYLLQSGHVYEVLETQTFKRSKRYFCTVDATNADIIEMSEGEVVAWLEQKTAAASKSDL
jgi:hypothetical protein